MALRRKAVVEWAEPALGELGAIARYIYERDPMAAQRFLARVDASVARLRTLPRLGRQVPEEPDHRELIVRPCRIIYRFAEPRVLVVHVRRFERASWPHRH
jgi:toxin ParE1/3/4